MNNNQTSQSKSKKDKNIIFSERLIQLRKEKGWQQQEVAKALDFTIGAFSTYEKGREPRYEYLNKIAKFYDVTVDYLTGNSDIKNPKMDMEKINKIDKLSIPVKEMHFKLLEYPKYIEMLDRISFWYEKANKWDVLQDSSELIKKAIPQINPTSSSIITTQFITPSIELSNVLYHDLKLERALYTMGQEVSKANYERYPEYKKESGE